MDFDTPYQARRVPVLARNVVATSQPLAVQSGIRALYQGGNAVDAALAAAITLTVVEPTGNGLGSDAFAIVWDGSELHGLNASGRAPAGWTPERFAGASSMPERGWESVTVPGAVSGWRALSDRFGKLRFEQLFSDAIAYAREGFAVSPTIARLWKSGADLLGRQPGFSEAFLPNGRAPKAGETFRNEPMADSLQHIAGTGGDAFYSGALAERIVQAAQSHGSALTLDDMSEHRADWCGTLASAFEDAVLHEIPPNSQGIAALMAVGILNHTCLRDFHPDSAESVHLQIEAVKRALWITEHHVGDPAFMKVTAEALLDPSRLEEEASRISPSRASDLDASAPRTGGTVYVTAADSSGMMVSFIQSNYAGFGSGIVVPGTGIHMQNRGMSFNTIKGHPNEVGPRKRPFHTIIPGFAMRDGAPLMSFGVMGGPMQAQGHVQMFVRTVLFGQSPQAASDAPRWRYVAGREVALEWSMSDEVAQRLAELGHLVQREAPDNNFGFGGAQLIMRHGDGFVAGSDHRKDGLAAGF